MPIVSVLRSNYTLSFDVYLFNIGYAPTQSLTDTCGFSKCGSSRHLKTPARFYNSELRGCTVRLFGRNISLEIDVIETKERKKTTEKHVKIYFKTSNMHSLHNADSPHGNMCMLSRHCLLAPI